MLSNRSMPRSSVIPVLTYPDVGKAVGWLCDAFGFTVRWQAGNHRAQLKVGEGAVAITERGPGKLHHSHSVEDRGDSVMVRIENIDAHYERAKARGANVLQPPTDFPYGERQYTVEDPAGHIWTFSQSIADVAPEEWGGKSVNL